MADLVGAGVVGAGHGDHEVAHGVGGDARRRGERRHQCGDRRRGAGAAGTVRVGHRGEHGAAGVDELGAHPTRLDAEAHADAACGVDVVEPAVGTGASDGLAGVDDETGVLETSDDLGHGGLGQPGAGGEVAARGRAVGEEQLEDRAVVEVPQQGRAGGGGTGHVSVSIRETYWKVSC